MFELCKCKQKPDSGFNKNSRPIKIGAEGINQSCQHHLGKKTQDRVYKKWEHHFYFLLL